MFPASQTSANPTATAAAPASLSQLSGNRRISSIIFFIHRGEVK